MSPASQDYQVLFGYLKLVASLPWSTTTEDRNDLQKSKLVLSMQERKNKPGLFREILDREHEGMGDVKKRILEFLAVKQLKQQISGPILCLVGAPVSPTFLS